MTPAQRLSRLVLSILLAALAGCATTRTIVSEPVPVAKNAPAVALIVRVAGGGRTLSPQEFSTIQQAVQGYISDAGYRFARNADAADFLVTVRFTPNDFDPKSGHVAITAIEPNPMKRRRDVEGDASRELQEAQQKMRDLERWIESKARNSNS